MSKLKPGLYEQVINQELVEQLASVPSNCQYRGSIDQAEASKVLSQYLGQVIQKSLDKFFGGDEGLVKQIELTNRIVALITQALPETDLASLAVSDCAQLLLALLQENDPKLPLKKTAKELQRPVTSLVQSSLFTGAVHEPSMCSELKSEIISANRIDMLVSFIKWSGLRLIWPELVEFTSGGGQLRLITTSYMGATDIKAVEELAQLPNAEIKVSYDTKRTRLHAKAYVVYRDTGFTTAYIGSSNLSNAAISSGLEWNVKVTAKDLPSTLDKIQATFDSYWSSSDFDIYTSEQRERLNQALKAENSSHSSSCPFIFDIRPYPFQQEILDKLKAEREVRHHYKNLVVAATGTGKTVISAFDYSQFCKTSAQGSHRLLFVAHRQEILEQSLHTFQGVLKDANFGELFVGNYRPDSWDHLFVSIQTFDSQKLYNCIPSDYYDYIVVDEFHHAAASTYRKLLNHFKPKILLGLTATPERMDGQDIFAYFEGRIAAEIRLPEAIDRQLLCPFQYLGVSDTIDLDKLRWSRGGYEKSDLTELYVNRRQEAEGRVEIIYKALDNYLADLQEVKGLGFCVSIEHAKFMAQQFTLRQIPSLALVGSSPEQERRAAKDKLVAGEIRFLFVVDIYNEGVDIPEVNTVLFLRPTESLTVFLQQLGRGLRLSENKDCLTVLDFIGQANKKYNFSEKFAALLSSATHSLQYELERGFISAPKGCYIQLEKKARQYILDNIKSSFNTSHNLVSRLASFEEDSGLKLSLSNFVNYYRVEVRTIYAKKSSFARLCVRAGLKLDFTEAIEEVLTRSLCALAAIDSRRWIDFLLKRLPSLSELDLAVDLDEVEQRMLQMFYITIWKESAESWSDPVVQERLATLAAAPHMLGELLELLQFKYQGIDFVDEAVDLGFASPLDLHCTYSRDQLLVALDHMKPSNVREGVKWLAEKKLDLLLVTLNKSDKDYSPTTMYEDYSLNERLFHWQSQSITDEASATGQRYINHLSQGSKVLLFVREFKKDLAGTSAYTFLGKANYLSHQGSRPMSVIWQLEKPIPAKFLKKTNKLDV